MKTFLNYSCLFLMAVVLLSSSACKKSDNTAINCRLTQILTTNIDTATITYDANGRVITYGSLGYSLFTLNYTGGLSATAVAHVTDTSEHNTYNLALNAQGNITFMSRHYVYNGGSNDYTFTFQYDADEHIVWCEQTLQGTGITGTRHYKDSLIYTDGNLTAKYTFVKDNSLPTYTLTSRTETTYTGSLNKIGQHAFYYIEEPISVTEGWDCFYAMFGKTSKNLPAVTRYYDSGTTLYFQWDYSFILNADGYPTEQSIVRSITNPGSINRKFQYSCN